MVIFHCYVSSPEGKAVVTIDHRRALLLADTMPPAKWPTTLLADASKSSTPKTWEIHGQWPSQVRSLIRGIPLFWGLAWFGHYMHNIYIEYAYRLYHIYNIYIYINPEMTQTELYSLSSSIMFRFSPGINRFLQRRVAWMAAADLLRLPLNHSMYVCSRTCRIEVLHFIHMPRILNPSLHISYINIHIYIYINCTSSSHF